MRVRASIFFPSGSPSIVSNNLADSRQQLIFPRPPPSLCFPFSLPLPLRSSLSLYCFDVQVAGSPHQQSNLRMWHVGKYRRLLWSMDDILSSRQYTMLFVGTEDFGGRGTGVLGHSWAVILSAAAAAAAVGVVAVSFRNRGLARG